MTFKTPDLCDEFSDKLQICEPMFGDFGGRIKFSGVISTIKCYEDNSLVRSSLEQPGQGKVLVVDGGGSMRCALLGDMLAELGVNNGWSGVIVYGCIRDSEDMEAMDIGVKAIATHPLKSVKKGVGEQDVPVTFGGVTFTPGAYVYADQDGVIISPDSLL